MRAPKGFGKRYFTLGAIQAYSGGATLQRVTLSLRSHHLQVSEECAEEELPEEDEPLLLETALTSVPGGRRRPCHCNRHFHKRTCNALRAHPRALMSVSPYRVTHSTLSPPPPALSASTNQLYIQGKYCEKNTLDSRRVYGVFAPA